nr:MAG TPA: hypothetical protein [Caudoviricetes sp.]
MPKNQLLFIFMPWSVFQHRPGCLKTTASRSNLDGSRI